MSYLPTLLNLNNKKVLVIGGGEIAARKIKFFLDFTNDVTIISPEISLEVEKIIDANKLQFLGEKVALKKIEKFDIVIAAVNNLTLQEEIYTFTRGKNILYSCVDFPKYCDFIFPSYIKKDDFLLTISTNSKAPALAKEFKTYLKKLIPDTISLQIEKMHEVRQTEQKGESRMKKLKEMAKDYIQGIE